MNALAAAARRTLEEESARITLQSFWHPPSEHGLTGSSGVGLVDFRRKRAYVRRSGWAGQVIGLIVERFPWLPPDDAEDPGDQDDPPIENIYADGESFWCVNDKWHRRDEETWAEADPVALLERLVACDEVHNRDGCLGFLIAEGRDRVYGDAWLDEEGRVDRVTYRWWCSAGGAHRSAPLPRRKGAGPSELETTYGCVVERVSVSVLLYAPVRSASFALIRWRYDSVTESLLIGPV